MSQDIRSLEALAVKVEMIHDDIIELKDIVKVLEEEHQQRKASLRIIVGAITGLATVLGWMLTKFKFTLF